jgi:hypothetical protein
MGSKPYIDQESAEAYREAALEENYEQALRLWRPGISAKNPKKHPPKSINIALFGPMGAGKSSYIASLEYIFHNISPNGRSMICSYVTEESHTRPLDKNKSFGNSYSVLPALTFIDTEGLPNWMTDLAKGIQEDARAMTKLSNATADNMVRAISAWMESAPKIDAYIIVHSLDSDFHPEMRLFVKELNSLLERHGSYVTPIAILTKSENVDKKVIDQRKGMFAQCGITQIWIVNNYKKEFENKCAGPEKSEQKTNQILAPLVSLLEDIDDRKFNKKLKLKKQQQD